MEPNTWINLITFNRVSLAEVLTQLAKKYNFFWYVDYDKDIHFFPKQEEEAPFEITDTSDNFIYGSLSVEVDFTQLRNKIIVRGGEAVFNERTQLISGTGDNKAFPLAYKFSEMPVVKVEGTEVDVAASGFNSEEDADVLWDYNQKSLEFADDAIPPVGEDNIEVTGKPLLPIAVYVNDFTSQNLYGLHEHLVEDKRLISRNDAIDFGNAELQAYAYPQYNVEFETYRQGLRSGQVIHIDSDSREIEDDLIIDSVSMILTTEKRPVWRVKATSYRTSKFVQMMQELFRPDDIDMNSLERLYGIQQISSNFTVYVDDLNIYAKTGPYYWNPVSGSNTSGIWSNSTWG